MDGVEIFIPAVLDAVPQVSLSKYYSFAVKHLIILLLMKTIMLINVHGGCIRAGRSIRAGRYVRAGGSVDPPPAPVDPPPVVSLRGF